MTQTNLPKTDKKEIVARMLKSMTRVDTSINSELLKEHEQIWGIPEKIHSVDCACFRCEERRT